MNVIFLSPHFPPNFYCFCVQVRQLGVNVLGIADEPYDNLRPELQQALTEYYRVDDMHDYDQLLRACGYFTHHYGKIDRIDSLNEYWLESEARLRADFNVFGSKLDEIRRARRKSQMKKVFKKAGIAVARGRVVRKPAQARRLIREIGYPIVAKPDSGMGAADTYKINDAADLERFFAQKSAVDYIMEEFIQGTICTFDGLTDRDGNVVFCTSHQYSQGVMETVNEDDHVYYFSLRDIPADLEEAGRRAVRAFDIRERFFHIEFFRTEKDGRLIALEVNMRPPGGLTTDMFNYANDFDIYAEWANIVVHNEFASAYARPYHCCYVGRKTHKNYLHSHEEILNRYGERIAHHERMSPIFSRAMGDYCYLIRSPDLDETLAIAHFIQRLR